MDMPAKDLPLAEKIRECQEECGNSASGYTEIQSVIGCKKEKYHYYSQALHNPQEGVLYFSIIRDLFDNSIVSDKTSMTQNVQLVLETIKDAKRKEKVTGELQFHSNQGFQYTSNQYFNLTQSYNILQSMSRRGNPYDNALAENFFSILKTECIYRVKLKTYDEARLLISQYIEFYNNQCIQFKTKLTPPEKRSQYIA